ncbi:MAG: tetratricopeptide repeat protein [Verrucomicrobiota bacterium]
MAVLAVVAAVAPAACKKQEPPRAPAGDIGPVRLNAQAEIDSYKEILRRSPENLQALIGLGNLYYDTNQDRLAIGSYERALKLDPSNANVRTDMAVCFRRTGDVDRAVEELKKAIATNPRHAQSRYNLGIILIYDKRDVDGGIKAWEGLLENVPDYPYRDSLKAEIARLRAEKGGSRQEYK